MKTIDYSQLHDVWLKDRNSGLLRRADEPYYASRLIADGVYRIDSEGCYTYLIEGDQEAVLIDTGYGAGNIRSFCQCLTSKPVWRVINTHDHFDHTALNGYFEEAIMSEATAPLATIPFPSFSGIAFPHEYNKRIVEDGDIIDLGGRKLEIFLIPDHAVGSIAILDTKSRILFAGDEIGAHDKKISTSVEKVAGYMDKLASKRGDFDYICHGHMDQFDASVIEKIQMACQDILKDPMIGTHLKPCPYHEDPGMSADGRIIWVRDVPHPSDMHHPSSEDVVNTLTYTKNGVTVQYDRRHIYA